MTKAQKTTIYIARHGETDMNKADRHQSGEIVDTQLNDHGIFQAQNLGEELKDKKIDFVYSSPLLRTEQTCQIALDAAGHKCEILFDERLIERMYGEAAGRTNTELGMPTFREDFWDLSKMDQFKGRFGESVMDLQKRVFEFIDEIKEKYVGKNIFMVAHAGVCRMFYIYFNGAPEDGKYRKFDIPKAKLLEYSFSS